jgi:hypothetical protein
MSYGGASKAKGCGQQDSFEGHFLFYPSLLLLRGVVSYV